MCAQQMRFHFAVLHALVTVSCRQAKDRSAQGRYTGDSLLPIIYTLCPLPSSSDCNKPVNARTSCLPAPRPSPPAPLQGRLVMPLNQTTKSPYHLRCMKTPAVPPAPPLVAAPARAEGAACLAVP